MDVQEDYRPAIEELKQVIADAKANNLIGDAFELNPTNVRPNIAREEGSDGRVLFGHGRVEDYMYPRAMISNWPWFAVDTYGSERSDLYPWQGSDQRFAPRFPRPIIRKDPFVLTPAAFSNSSGQKSDISDDIVISIMDRAVRAIERVMAAANVNVKFNPAIFMSRKPIPIGDVLLMDADYRGFKGIGPYGGSIDWNANNYFPNPSNETSYNMNQWDWTWRMGYDRGDLDRFVRNARQMVGGTRNNPWWGYPGVRDATIPNEAYEVNGCKMYSHGWQSVYRMRFSQFFKLSPGVSGYSVCGTEDYAFMKSLRTRRKVGFCDKRNRAFFDSILNDTPVDVSFADAMYELCSILALADFITTVPPHAFVMAALQMHFCMIDTAYQQLGLRFGDDVNAYAAAIQAENANRERVAVNNAQFVLENGFAITAGLANPSSQSPADSIVGSNTNPLGLAVAAAFVSPASALAGIGITALAAYLAYIHSDRAQNISYENYVLRDQGSWYKTNIYPGYTPWNVVYGTPVRRIP